MEMEQPTYPMIDSAARWPVVSCAERPTGDTTTQNKKVGYSEAGILK